MTGGNKGTLGQAIDGIVAALESIEEGARFTALRAAAEHLGLPWFASDARETFLRAPAEASTPDRGNPTFPDIRGLKEQKAPTSAVEMACVVAYYLDAMAPPTERKKEIATADLEKYFKQAQYKLPARIAQVLVNARAAGYFDSGGYGKYRLNPVGYNLVVHNLPKTKK